MTSTELGNNVTMNAVVIATGSIPLLVFLRAKFKNYMLNGASHGNVGAATKSGWLNEVIFLQFLEHFISNA